jgi:polyhydroxybutyrate depolymerase
LNQPIELTAGGRPHRFALTLPEFSSRNTAAGGVGGTRVAAWTVLGGGHTWPGGKPFPGAAQTGPREFDAAEEICRFAEPLLAPADGRRLPRD